nr:Fe-S cluster assembly scaffold protein NifU [Bacillota bacterium]
MDHFYNPRNVGEIEDPSGVGVVGNPICGDLMKIFIKVDENGIIRDVKFKTFGCASAIASSSIATEMIKGKHVDEARKITNQAIVEALDGLPPHKIHCSVLAADAINMAIDDYMGIKRDRELIICKCLNIPREFVEEAIRDGADTFEAVKKATGAGTGACQGTRCQPLIQQMIDEYRESGEGAEEAK